MKLVSAEQMRNLDSTTIDELGVPGIVLMENAGTGTIEVMGQHFGNLVGKVVSIFVGPGNNGGDGLVIARFLHQEKARPQVFLLVDPDKLQGDAATNLAVVQKLPIPIYPLQSDDDFVNAEEHLVRSRVVVDAIFGTGLKREVSEIFAQAIQRINSFTCPVVSVDIPSGLDSDNGHPLGICVQADLTATYGLAKPGQVVHPGAQYTGDLEVIDIGIPPEIVNRADIRLELLDKMDVAQWVPQRQTAAHKGTFGHLLILAGSEGKTGAAILCGKGALRSGAGLVTLCVPQELNTIFEATMLEAMTVPLPKSLHGRLSIEDYDLIEETVYGKQAIVIGPGIGVEEETAELIVKLYQEVSLPMVVDADALNILAGDKEALRNPGGPRILTPHPGEMARLIESTAEDVQKDRLQTASALAKENNVYVVLKGAGTVIADPDGHIAINSTGNPGMAAGGMGDVLSGIVGSLLAQGLSPWQAACLGVYVHGLAGDLLAEETGVGSGYLAAELANGLPLAFNELVG